MDRAYRVGLTSAWLVVVGGSAAIGQNQTAPSVDLTGKWSLTVRTDEGPQPRTLEVTMARDGALSGTVESSLGSVAISSGRMRGDSIHFELRMAGGEIRVDLDLVVRNDTLRGTFRQDQWTGEVQGVRVDPHLSEDAAKMLGGHRIRREEALQRDLRDRYVHRRPEDRRGADEGQHAVARVELQRDEHPAVALRM